MAAPPHGLRLDGRGPEEFRKLFIDTQVISRAKGSAYVEFGATKLMVGVYGPRASERKFGFQENGRIVVEAKLSCFAAPAKSKLALQGLERTLAAAVQQAISASVQLHRFPKSVVDVYVFVLEAGGGEVATAITAASVALADAGIELYDLVPACHMSKAGGRLILDPTSSEATHEDAGAMVAMMPTSNQVTQLTMTGEWSAPETREVLELALGACSQLKAAMRAALVDAVA